VPDACRENCKDPSCGDGVTDGPENCDDANDIETDACRNDCTYNVCGDGIVDVTEEGCDDANNDNTDACLSTCIGATCGDGIVQLEKDEVCDDGPSSCSGGFDAGEDCATDVDCRGICTSGGNAGQACRVATEVDDCGQPGLCSDAGAVCDDLGNNDQEADACRSTCKAAFCGDGVLDLAENCDSSAPSLNNYCMVSDVGGPPSLVAPYNCAYATCGDGIVCSGTGCDTGPNNGVEECDDGNNDDNDGCRNDCGDNICGDGVVNTGVEECDNGGLNSDTTQDACRENCEEAHCGDGVLDTPENCDDGNTVNGDICPNSCVFPSCGDGIVCNDPACTTGFGGGIETCDDDNNTNLDGCDSTCRIEGCGDGIGQAPEQCDDAAVGTNPPVAEESATCDLDCTVADCGDGTVNQTRGEACDDGNMLSLDGCDIACQDEFCGDGIDNDGTNEECDDGGLNSDTLPDACRENCEEAGCGDSVTDGPENCDDGAETAGCDDDCTFQSCGDGNLNETAGEECDDDGANAFAPDACRPTCELPRPADGILDPGYGEICDGGPFGNASCNPDGCSTGDAPESYVNGYNGADCEIGGIEGACFDVAIGFDDCSRGSSIEKNFERIKDRLEMSEYREIRGNLGWAERNARQARRRAQRILEKLGDYCPESALVRSCFEVHLGDQDHLVDILVELEANLAANNP
jgi:cysteine-rich repeat protein